MIGAGSGSSPNDRTRRSEWARERYWMKRGTRLMRALHEDEEHTLKTRDEMRQRDPMPYEER